MDTDYNKFVGLMESFGVDIEKHGQNEIEISGGSGYDFHHYFLFSSVDGKFLEHKQLDYEPV